MRRIALVSCVKSKQSSPAPAGELYISPLFKGLRAYAKANADEWYILSARYGLLAPQQVVEPYEMTLNNMPKVERQAWGARVRQQLREVLPSHTTMVLLAGARYREEIEPFLREQGHLVEIPLLGLPMGRQQSWLKGHLADRHVR
jgi:cytoplasmic iron level regulating protein YaaA (DUF328/UPF0246 family)